MEEDAGAWAVVSPSPCSPSSSLALLPLVGFSSLSPSQPSWDGCLNSCSVLERLAQDRPDLSWRALTAKKFSVHP